MRKKSTDLTDKQWKEIKPFRCSILSRRFKVETIFHRILQYIVFIAVVVFGTEFCNIFSKAFKIGCLLAVVAYKANIKNFCRRYRKTFIAQLEEWG